MPKILNGHIYAYIRKHAGYKTSVEMASELKVHQATILKYAHKMGLSLVHVVKAERSERLKELVMANYRTMTAPEIAKLANVPIASVRWIGWTKRIKFLRQKEKPSRNSKPLMTGEYFIESEHENWLI